MTTAIAVAAVIVVPSIIAVLAVIIARMNERTREDVFCSTIRACASIEARRIGPYRLIVENGKLLRVLRDDEGLWVIVDVICELCDAMEKGTVSLWQMRLDWECRRRWPRYVSPLEVYRAERKVRGRSAALAIARQKARQAWNDFR